GPGSRHRTTLTPPGQRLEESSAPGKGLTHHPRIRHLASDRGSCPRRPGNVCPERRSTDGFAADGATLGAPPTGSVAIPGGPAPAAPAAAVDVQAGAPRLECHISPIPRLVVGIEEAFEKGPRVARPEGLQGHVPAAEVGHRLPAAEQPAFVLPGVEA